MNQAQERLIEAAGINRDLNRIARVWPTLPRIKRYYLLFRIYYIIHVWQPINDARKKISELFL